MTLSGTFQRLSGVAVVALLAACSGATVEDTNGGSAAETANGSPTDTAKAPSSGTVRVETTRISGSFGLHVDGDADDKRTRYTFVVSEIDFSARTAKWNAKVVDNAGRTDVTDDVDVPMKVVAYRDLNNWDFIAGDDTDGHIKVEIRGGALGSLTYFDNPGLEATLTDTQ